MQQPTPWLDVAGPDGPITSVQLERDRITAGRLPEANDIALGPDPQHLVTRQTHCYVERDGGGWWVVDNGSVNGTFLRRARDGAMEQVQGRVALSDGDTVCILAAFPEAGDAQYWTMTFRDPAKTRPVSVITRAPCLEYDWLQARLYRAEGALRGEITGLRPQEHKLIRYMAQRNQANGGVPVLCSYEELITGIWGDEAMHTQDEVAHLVWGLRRKIEIDPNLPRLLETERGLGYRLRTCPRSG